MGNQNHSTMNTPNYVAWPGMDLARMGAPSIVVAIGSVSKAYGYAYGIDGLGLDDCQSDRRVRHLSNFRQLCMFTLHRILGYTTTMTGELMARDHATVLHGCRKITDHLTYDRRVRMVVESVINDLNGFGYHCEKSDYIPPLKAKAPF